MLQLPNGRVPFREWADGLSPKDRIKILVYVDRAAYGGSKKNIKALGDKLFEIKIDYGPGYRVYFGETDNSIILVLLGGDKSTQKRDILKARKYWSEYAL
ncbi:MAG: type II toxin-antitoxin system RelE/ParE family toxin [Bdellovibrionaceae bacterium]|nr:type II toxin-antitoxin system RelE/ParE family toxin [Pseudobdellovibrionaceae bacterium]